MARKFSDVTYDVSDRERCERLHHIEKQLAAVKAGKRPRGRPVKELPPSSYSSMEQHAIIDRLYEIEKERHGKRGVHIVVYRRLKHRNASNYLKIEASLVRPLKGFERPSRLTEAQYMAFKVFDQTKEFVEVLHVDDHEVFPPAAWYPAVRSEKRKTKQKAVPLERVPQLKREARLRYWRDLGIKEPRRRRGRPISELSRAALYERQREERRRLRLPPLPRRGRFSDNPKPSTIARRDRLRRQRLGLSGAVGRPRCANPTPAALEARRYRQKHRAAATAANQ